MWWPGLLVLIAAPFVTYGGMWLKEQRTIAAHVRVLDAERENAQKAATAAYQQGHRVGVESVRSAEAGEVERTREVIREVERLVEVPPATPAEVLELCRRSASCRERGELK
jgi:hypothetical protein